MKWRKTSLRVTKTGFLCEKKTIFNDEILCKMHTTFSIKIFLRNKTNLLNCTPKCTY